MQFPSFAGTNFFWIGNDWFFLLGTNFIRFAGSRVLLESHFVYNFDSGVNFGGIFFCGNIFADREKETQNFSATL